VAALPRVFAVPRSLTELDTRQKKIRIREDIRPRVRLESFGGTRDSVNWA